MDAGRNGNPGDAGVAAEHRALRQLQAAGLRLVARNFRTRVGEIDLVMQDGITLVFVEVRLRGTARFGGAVHSVGAAKRRRLRATAALFLARHRRFASAPARFDVIAFDASGAPGDWIRGAFG